MSLNTIQKKQLDLIRNKYFDYKETHTSFAFAVYYECLKFYCETYDLDQEKTANYYEKKWNRIYREENYER